MWAMPPRRINPLKSLAANCGPSSEMTRGVMPGNRSRARWMICSMSTSVITYGEDFACPFNR